MVPEPSCHSILTNKNRHPMGRILMAWQHFDMDDLLALNSHVIGLRIDQFETA
jgi:hypothetical protein